MGMQKAIKRTANQEAWEELDAADGGKGARLVIPIVLLQHPNYRRMSYAAKAVLWDICSDYNGSNNGYLSAEWSKFKNYGWGSHHTMRDAIAEVIYYGWLVQTQVGGRDHRPNLFGLTWRKLNRRTTQPLHIPSDCDFVRPSSHWKQPRARYVKPRKG
jgi:hypothetical protein